MNRSIHLVLFGWLLTLASCVVATPAAAPCNDDRDCSGAEVCRAGRCELGAKAPDANGGDDAGTPDAGPRDADSGLADSGLVDSGLADSGLVDSGLADSGLADSGLADSGLADSGLADSGLADSGLADGGPPDAGNLDAGPPLVDPLWWDPAWTFRHRVTLDLSGWSGREVGVPVPVRLDTERMDLSALREDARDLRFIGADGVAVLPHDIEHVGPDEVLVWVRLPLVDSEASEAFFWIYGGNPEAPDLGLGAEVWADGFAGVWHFAEAAPLEDASPSALVGEDQGSLLAQQGFLGAGRRFDGAGYAVLAEQAPFVSGAPAVTFEAWIRREQQQPFDKSWLLSVAGAEPGLVRLAAWIEDDDEIHRELGLRLHSIVRPRDGSDEVDDFDVGTSVVTAGIWRHLAWVVDLPARRQAFYVDGVLVEERLDADFSGELFDEAPSARVVLGAEGSGLSGLSGVYRGLLDEVRVSRVARTGAFIALSHRAMRDRLLTFGAQQTRGPPQADDLRVAVDEGLPRVFLLPAEDPGGDPLTYTLETLPAHGTLTLDGGRARYMPEPGYTGPDAFTFAVADPAGGTDEATVTLEVRPWAERPYPYRVLLALDVSGLSGPTGPVPVPVSTDPSELGLPLPPAGERLGVAVYAPGSEEQLPSEIELLRPDEATLWVQAALDPAEGEDAYLWVYLGADPGAEAPPLSWGPEVRAVWHLGGDLEDASGNDHPLTSPLAPQQGPRWMPGVAGLATRIVTGEYLERPASPGLDPSGDVTVSGWFWLPAGHNAQHPTRMILEKFDNNSHSFQLALTGQGFGGGGLLSQVPLGRLLLKVERGGFGTWYVYSGTGTWQPNRWYSFAAVIRGGDIDPPELYVDGELDVGGSVGSGTTGDLSFSTRWRLGGTTSDVVNGGSSTVYLDGALDEVRVFARALSAAEIALDHHLMTASVLIPVGLEESNP